jgi:hypothetical protein
MDFLTQRCGHMQNYLRVVADIFYESYDERRFPTVLDRLMVTGQAPRERSTASRTRTGARRSTTDSSWATSSGRSRS